MSEYEGPSDRFDQCDAHSEGGERCCMEAGHVNPDHSFERTPEDRIHEFFGLTYANYLVVNRSLLQSMPDEWQDKFIVMLVELFEEMGWAQMLQESISVRILKREPERKPDRVTCESCDGSGEGPDVEDNEDATCIECDGDGEVETEGDEFETPEEVGIVTDPIAHYQRGRTRVPMASTPLEEVQNGYYAMVGEWMRANHIDEFRKLYGPEYEDGEKVGVVRNVPPHVLPPVLEETPHGYWDAEIVTVCEASDNALYMVDVALGPFEESDHITVQLHADQIKKAPRAS